MKVQISSAFWATFPYILISLACLFTGMIGLGARHTHQELLSTKLHVVVLHEKVIQLEENLKNATETLDNCGCINQ